MPSLFLTRYILLLRIALIVAATVTIAYALALISPWLTVAWGAWFVLDQFLAVCVRRASLYGEQ